MDAIGGDDDIGLDRNAVGERNACDVAVLFKTRAAMPGMDGAGGAIGSSGAGPAADAEGNIYVVFSDCRFRSNCSDPVAANGCRYNTDNASCTTNDLVLVTSKDGVTWTAPMRVPNR